MLVVRLLLAAPDLLSDEAVAWSELSELSRPLIREIELVKFRCFVALFWSFFLNLGSCAWVWGDDSCGTTANERCLVRSIILGAVYSDMPI